MYCTDWHFLGRDSPDFHILFVQSRSICTCANLCTSNCDEQDETAPGLCWATFLFVSFQPHAQWWFLYPPIFHCLTLVCALSHVAVVPLTFYVLLERQHRFSADLSLPDSPGSCADRVLSWLWSEMLFAVFFSLLLDVDLSRETIKLQPPPPHFSCLLQRARSRAMITHVLSWACCVTSVPGIHSVLFFILPFWKCFCCAACSCAWVSVLLGMKHPHTGGVVLITDLWQSDRNVFCSFLQ